MRYKYLLANFIVLIGASIGSAGDWPQILGPRRDGVAVNESVSPWSNPLKIDWQVDCGAGYAGVAVVDDQVVLTHRIDDALLVDCLDANDGKRKWRAEFDATYQGGYNADRGPRCVPVVAGDQVFCYSAGGELHALNIKGQRLWSRKLRQDLDAEDGYFGAGSTPIVVGTKVIVAVGGREGGIVAVDRGDGHTVWKSTKLEADYASPVQLDDSTVIVPMRLTTVGLDVDSGKQKFAIDFGQRGLTVVGTTPVLAGSRLLLSASYRIGAKLVDIQRSPPKPIWESDQILSSQYNSGVIVDGFIYGVHGREDQGIAELRCVELESGKVRWTKSDFGVAHLIAVGKQLLIEGVDGEIRLVAADPNAFKLQSEFALPPGTYRALPALSNGRLFCRSTDRGSGKLYAVSLPR